jgi:hypothetical protein
VSTEREVHAAYAGKISQWLDGATYHIGVFEPLYVEPASGLRGYELGRAEYPSQALLFQVYTAWGVVPNFVTSLRNEKVCEFDGKLRKFVISTEN